MYAITSRVGIEFNSYVLRMQIMSYVFNFYFIFISLKIKCMNLEAQFIV